jgi:predicted HNH restriction endonuclease
VGANVNSIKNWRDEFDGLNPNPNRKRKGWNRKPTASRVYMKMQLDSWTYEQLLNMTRSILRITSEFSDNHVNSLFAWAINGKNNDATCVVEAISAGVLSFLESQEIHAIEGGRKLVTHLKIEREPRIAREAVLRHVRDLGPVCRLCVLDFSRQYNLGTGEHCLEAHHKLPLSNRSVPFRTNLEDFLIVCPSCHRVIHKKRAFDGESMLAIVRK